MHWQVLVFALALATVAFGRGRVFQFPEFGGTCTQDNTQLLENGTALSVLFDDFGIQMPLGEEGDGKLIRKTCWIRLTITPPSGSRLVSLRQVYEGGILKSTGTFARFVVRYRVAQRELEVEPFFWRELWAIGPTDPRAHFQKVLEDTIPRTRDCGQPVPYWIHLTFLAGRQNTQNQFILGGLDSLDVEARRKMELIPSWGGC